ncbi:NAD(P)-dependent oxidoreductase [Flavobacterium gawalongense]|uniref:NAD-dependent epimerase/dehydratase family protein n=1 Tax=Flavobacterium gawalongense TaxID=2594432 RepID=A0A553BQS4_9FLAO|nr:NAD(P)H-binding protein [Flavobacterium gawalongense]TRX00937.1 NAD-dependent epimerase/dehydratase family protein [Flavobacterium gawalongense]TRX05524.1 NAD-dependent epimerase/dehydratase family protein [Flavobacterium gawalongense]TRX10612.1 NAD-dependent epimerase/dehydratase family protein [Flavobacterium gawalongense]TRX11761.1 NAD-dependent epimerase/dehydratase family protein [Flavobacterium gawalongense]TRX29553.1 NAD-dependent epimerase/dehydratase family protein [Flavobacterium 
MKIAIIGATGFVGSTILNELASRNHEVTAIARNPKNDENATVKWEKADINNVEKLSKIIAGNDVVISAFNAGWTNPNLYTDFLEGSKAIQEAVKKSGVKRFITIGGGGSLFVAPNLQAVDTPDFPKEYYAGATAARDYLNIIKEEKDLDWAFFSPAFEMHQGITTGRTGKYRLGLDNPVFDENQRSILSVEDLAVVIADEVENPKHHQVRFTAAY